MNSDKRLNKKMEEEVLEKKKLPAELDDNEDESDDDDENEEGDIPSLEELRRQHESSPYSIEIAIKLLMCYKMAGLTAELTKLREQLVEIFALPELIWVDWIEDFIKDAKTPDDRKGVLKIFERALEDFDYLDVAGMYCKYAKKLCQENIIRKNYMKNVYEKMIAMFCHEFDKGSKFFSKYRKAEFETLTSENDEKLRNESKKLIRNLFIRQLRLPLAAIDLTWDEYSKWEQDPTELAKAQSIYEETYKKVEKILDLEEKFGKVLAAADVSMLIYYVSTLDVKEYGSEKVQNLYERALDEFQYNEELWKVYLDFVQENVPIRQQLKYYRRGSRHCPTNGVFVRNYMRCLEMNNAELEEIEKQFAKCISVVVEPQDQFIAWEFLCQFAVRRLRTGQAQSEGKKSAELDKNAIIFARITFQRAVDNFSNKFNAGETEVFLSDIELFWAYTETHVVQSKEYVEKIMEKYIRRNGGFLNAWKEYINMMIILKAITQARALIKRCCEYTKDDLEGAYVYSIDFEKKWGSMEELLNAEKKFKNDLNKIIESKKQKENIVEQDDHKSKSQKSREKKDKSKPNERLNKRKGKPLDRNEIEGSESSEESRDEEEDQEDVSEHKNRKSRRAIPHDNENSVFVKNFPLAFSDKDLLALFYKQKADIVECRLIKDKKGMSRGYAYIDFKDKESALESIKLNGAVIEDKTLFVALSAPPTRVSKDERTLFLNNLPFKVTDKKIRESLSEIVEHITDIRIITDETGKPKGYGYIEFKSEEAKENALKLYKGKLVLDGRKIDVKTIDSNKNKTAIDGNNVVLLKNLSFKSREKDIREFFSEFKISKVNVVKEGNQPKGYAFVEFESHEEIEVALDMKEGYLNGRKFFIIKSNRDITERKEKMDIEHNKGENRGKKVRIQLDGDVSLKKPAKE